MSPELFDCDLLVVDYTKYHQDHPEEELPSEGVHFLNVPDIRLGSFCVRNPKPITIEAINLEKTHSLTKKEDGSTVKQCECICKAHREDGEKRWVLLLELKYCSEKNIPDNMLNAMGKFEKYVDFLMGKHYFDDAPYNIYVCASHPEHEVTESFGSFLINQDRILTLSKKGVRLLYTNAVKAISEERLIKVDTPEKYKFIVQ